MSHTDTLDRKLLANTPPLGAEHLNDEEDRDATPPRLGGTSADTGSPDLEEFESNDRFSMDKAAQKIFNGCLKRIESSRKRRAKAHFDLLQAVRALPATSRVSKAAILASEFELSKLEATRLVSLADTKLSGNEKLVQGLAEMAVATDVIDATLRASQRVRGIIASHVESGDVIHISDIANIRKSFKSRRTIDAANRRRTVSAHADAHYRRRRAQYIEQLRDLAELLISSHPASDPQPGARASVSELASRLYPEFGTFFDLDQLKEILDTDERNRVLSLKMQALRLPEEQTEARKLSGQWDNRWTKESIRLAEGYRALTDCSSPDFWSLVDSDDGGEFKFRSIIQDVAWLSGLSLKAFDRLLFARTSAHPMGQKRRAARHQTPKAEPKPPLLTTLEICAGAGGQALGLHHAGFRAVGLYEQDRAAVNTLLKNPLLGPAFQKNVRDVDFSIYDSLVTLFAGGVPCQPFSSSGKGLGPTDERDLFMDAVGIIAEAKPCAIMLENVRGFGLANLALYRGEIVEKLQRLGYETSLVRINARDFGLPQNRPRVILIGFLDGLMRNFRAPKPIQDWNITLGEALYPLMAERGWKGAAQWRDKANKVAPCLTGAYRYAKGFAGNQQLNDWRELGVEPLGIAAEAPGPDAPIDHMPQLTLKMAAMIQGFPEHHVFTDDVIETRRQIANALPPVMGAAMGLAIKEALTGKAVDFVKELDALRCMPGRRTPRVSEKELREEANAWIDRVSDLGVGLPVGESSKCFLRMPRPKAKTRKAAK